ncbi:MAG: peptide MFS transporter [Chloroflexi bacterium]|nr:peptide MFS transporter [Chloroflexota bacterium]
METDKAGQVYKEKHPKGLYVLFMTEMWERFSFYTMLSLLVLYLRDPNGGLGWSTEKAVDIYSYYLTFVYFTPLIGGFLADKYIGYRRAISIGALFFIAGHILLAFPSPTIMYVALLCLIIGNGFFKPNISTMLGNLYPEESKLKDAAYNIFYMGINIGAFASPIVAEIVKAKFGYHPAFAVAAGGMVISLAIFWGFGRYVVEKCSPKDGTKDETAVPCACDAEIDKVPESKRIWALIVIFLVTIVFWMAFDQNGSTLTIWADENTKWSVSGVISNSINPFWIIILTFPLLAFWKHLAKYDREPSTPTKMVYGMLLCALSFYIMYYAAIFGGNTGKVSPWWLISSYGVVTLGELMLSPMALSLVSKVAPRRLRGMMMGLWFASTAIGNKLSVIGKYWEVWSHSKFFFILATLSLFTALVLVLILKPIKKAMPGV